MSLGIIVTLFCMDGTDVASSMRLTIYACATSCRHIIVLPWQCKSYLPTSRAISWTNHEKGSFQMRSFVLFCNCQISWRATVPGQYILVFLTLTAWRIPSGEFCLHSRLELPPDWLLLTQLRWPGLCSHLGQLLGWQWWRWSPCPLKLFCLCNPPHYLLSLWMGLFGWSRGWTDDEGLFSLPSTLVTALICSICVLALLFPCLRVTLVLTMLEGNLGALANRKAVWLHSC